MTQKKWARGTVNLTPEMMEDVKAYYRARRFRSFTHLVADLVIADIHAHGVVYIPNRSKEEESIWQAALKKIGELPPPKHYQASPEQGAAAVEHILNAARRSVLFEYSQTERKEPVAAEASMAEILDFPVVETDHERRVTYCNEAFTRLCGWELKELKGERLGERIQGEETEPDVVQQMREALNAKKPIEVTVTNHRKDKTLYRSRVFIRPTAQGFAAVVTDVKMGLQGLTGRKKSLPPVLPGAGRATETKRKAADG